MLKNLLKILIILGIIVGVFYGVSISSKKSRSYSTSYIENSLYEKMQTKPAELINFYTYGKAFGLTGKISNVNEDNFENAKLYITNGNGFEENLNLDVEFQENDLIVSVKEINNTIILDNLDDSNYYFLVRLKVNNSVEPRFYSFTNQTKDSDIDYYTVRNTGEEITTSGKKGTVHFIDGEYQGKQFSLMYLHMEDAEIPNDVYDIVIDAGHGGKDRGEVKGKFVESDIALKYAKALKEKLDVIGYQVAMTRDDSNTDTFTSRNMYDPDGRISLACKSKAKLMISFHVNNDALANLTGFEIYCPCKSNLNFAGAMADSIKSKTSIAFSNNNTNKMRDGVYVRNYTKDNIRDSNASSKRKGYEPYPLTLDTPFLYTIREVGGIATNAYADGRNKEYAKNEFYDSNHGIECYQIELGYIKNDTEIIENEMDLYTQAIAETINANW
ncbi:MAG: N-acetylmuramoyl-L-alanine amidase [Clostridia bacterium]|nr:N-acetylmuramoyl-L-alanine amidase [Clostridia bacterium]